MSASVVRVEGELTIQRAAELLPALLAPLISGATVNVDLSAVQEIDCAGVQLLMLARDAAKQRGATLRLSEPSPAVMNVLSFLRVAGSFAVAA